MSLALANFLFAQLKAMGELGRSRPWVMTEYPFALGLIASA